MLEVPLKRSDNVCMMNKKEEVTWNEFATAIERLSKLEHGHTVYCWLRRRASAHYEHFNDGNELEGSSDVTCYMFELWKSWIYSGRGVRRILNDGFGFWINGEIVEELGLPNVKATREYHNHERA
tara:strand:+ start:35 stop:409 length:375 start_codon:yes stop_codon:yes gene_type:complete